MTVGPPNPNVMSRILPGVNTVEARTIVGRYLGYAVPSRDIPRFAQWWREGRPPIERLISRAFALDEINEAKDDLADGTTIRKVVVFD